jgi:hypothetical protein
MPAIPVNKVVDKKRIIGKQWRVEEEEERHKWSMVYFYTKNTNLGMFWRAPGMENVGRFYDHLEYFTAIWYNLWPFGIFEPKNMANLPADFRNAF